MARENPPSQVLPTTGNAAPIAKGNGLGSLAVGQIGVFNVHSGLSVDATSQAQDLREVFLAVGVDPAAVGSTQDIIKSSGQVIQARHVTAATLKGYVADLPKIVDVYGFQARCDSDYAIRAELRNSDVYGLHGFNQFAKTFDYHTGCCADPCNDCGTGDAIELAVGIAANINADPDKLITATFFSNSIGATVTAGAPTASGTLTVTIGSTVYSVPVVTPDSAATVAGKIVAIVNAQAGSPYIGVATGAVMKFYLKADGLSTDTFALTATGGTGATVGAILAQTKTIVADPAVFKAANANAILGLRLTTSPMALHQFLGINVNYKKLRATNIIVSLPVGFTCNGSVTTIQELQYAEGKGYDLVQQEYVAAGWNGRNGGIYRTSSITGLIKDGVFNYVNSAGTYQQLVYTYDQMSTAGWGEYLNNLETVVAIPCADTTTLTGLVAIMDVVLAAKFPPMANDAALLDCTNVATHTINDITTDGIDIES